MIDFSKPIRTRKGTRADHLRAINTQSGIRHAVAITYSGSNQMVELYTSDGRLMRDRESPFDIVQHEPPTTHIGYLVVVDRVKETDSWYVMAQVYPTRQRAAEAAHNIFPSSAYIVQSVQLPGLVIS
jgi:hypothetical protein